MAFSPTRARAVAAGYRSGLEAKTQADLKTRGAHADFECLKVGYEKPASKHKYTPDFLLENEILVETKGRWDVADRQKHALIRKQLPDLDLRIVFQRSASPIRKGSKTTYADVCRKLGIPFADKIVPQEWLDEPKNPTRSKALEAARVH